jgi:hypothetical protein
MKLMQSLERIEKKLDKESESTKSGSQGSPGDKRRTSVSRHHCHSSRHSNKRAHNNSSTSPVRKHKRYGVYEIRGEMNKIKPPTFYGEHKKDEDADRWLLDMINYFQLHNYSSHAKGRIFIYHFKGKESMWWDQLVQA